MCFKWFRNLFIRERPAFSTEKTHDSTSDILYISGLTKTVYIRKRKEVDIMLEFKGTEALAYYNALLVEKEKAVANEISQFASQKVQERLDEQKAIIEADVILEITTEVEAKFDAEINLLKKFIDFPEEIEAEQELEVEEVV